METNKKIADIFAHTVELLDVMKAKQETVFKVNAYRKAIHILNNLTTDISDVYKDQGLAGIKKLGIGEKNAKKIEEFIKKGTVKDFEKLRQETAVQTLIAHFFKSKGVDLKELKESAKSKKIRYPRFTKPAQQLLELAGSIEKAKEAIDIVAAWANSRKLDYAIETIFKKWLELDRLKPKEVVKKPFYRGDPMIWSDARKKWYVISKYGEWLLFAGKEADIEWKTIE